LLLDILLCGLATLQRALDEKSTPK